MSGSFPLYTAVQAPGFSFLILIMLYYIQKYAVSKSTVLIQNRKDYLERDYVISSKERLWLCACAHVFKPYAKPQKNCSLDTHFKFSTESSLPWPGRAGASPGSRFFKGDAFQGRAPGASWKLVGENASPSISEVPSHTRDSFTLDKLSVCDRPAIFAGFPFGKDGPRCDPKPEVTANHREPQLELFHIASGVYVRVL